MPPNLQKMLGAWTMELVESPVFWTFPPAMGQGEFGSSPVSARIGKGVVIEVPFKVAEMFAVFVDATWAVETVNPPVVTPAGN